MPLFTLVAALPTEHQQGPRSESYLALCRATLEDAFLLARRGNSGES